MLCNLFALVSLLVFSSVSGQIEGIEGDEGFEGIEVQAAPEVKSSLGNGTVSEQISFMASLRVRASDSPYGNGHICGAAFVTRRHLLTAAVCLVKIERVLRPEHLIVVAGSRLRYAAPGAHVFDVANIHIPEKYQRFPVLGMDWNVAIIELAADVPSYIDTISFIDFTNTSVEVDSSCTFYGWGKPESMLGSKDLLKGDIIVIDNSECIFTYKNHFCAGPDFIGGCEGDDGSAVVCDGMLYGLVGWRYVDYCQETYNAHMYVDIAPFHQWISVAVSKSDRIFSSLVLLIGAAFVATFANQI